jgi:hypothetical protein
MKDRQWATDVDLVMKDLDYLGVDPLASCEEAEAAYHHGGSHKPRAVLFPAQLYRQNKALRERLNLPASNPLT